mgnify:CR=1 FL=1
MVSILCTSRSGSTNLSLYLKQVFDIKLISSPFLNDKEKKIDFLKENNFYKHMIHSLPLGYNDLYEFGKDVIKLSNTVILLDRKNKIKQAESLAFRKYKYKNDYSKYHIREPYNIIDKKLVDKCLLYYNKQSDVIKQLSSDFNLPIFWYEDIYFNNGLEKLSKYLNVKINNKYKKKYLLQKNKERVDNLKGELI